MDGSAEAGIMVIYAQLFGYTNVYPLGTLLTMKTKDAGLRIRVDRELREAFVAVCRAQDNRPLRSCREFMREYVERNPLYRAKPGTIGRASFRKCAVLRNINNKR